MSDSPADVGAVPRFFLEATSGGIPTLLATMFCSRAFWALCTDVMESRLQGPVKIHLTERVLVL